MMKTRIILFLVSTFLLLNYNCARIGSPNGGPKDSIAPVMAIAKPNNKSLNFNKEKITIEFDEYIKLNNIQSQLIISPPMEKKPLIRPIGAASKKITIEFAQDLLPNTTYTINFGKSIVDNNEGNELGNFSYVFSTGDKIDSLTVKGNIIDPFSPDKIKDISIFLYKQTSLDSLPYRPNYVSSTLDSTIFIAENIKNGTYQIIALEDKNKNYQYDKGFERIAFMDSIIDLQDHLILNDLTLFKESKPTKIFRPTQTKGNQIIIPYRATEKPNIKILNPDRKNFIISHKKDTDSLFVWFKKAFNDSLRLNISIDTLTQNLTYKPRELKLDSLELTNPGRSILHPRDSISFSTNTPISKIISDSIQLIYRDSIPLDFKINYAPNSHDFTIDFKRAYNENYKLNLKNGAVIDIFDQISKSKKLNYRTLDTEEYGEINLEIQNNSNAQLLIYLMDEKLNINEIKIFNSEKGTVLFSRLEPKKYVIKAVIDSNKNNIFDNGNFNSKLLPEKIVNYRKIIFLRANSEIIENMTIN